LKLDYRNKSLSKHKEKFSLFQHQQPTEEQHGIDDITLEEDDMDQDDGGEKERSSELQLEGEQEPDKILGDDDRFEQDAGVDDEVEVNEAASFHLPKIALVGETVDFNDAGAVRNGVVTEVLVKVRLASGKTVVVPYSDNKKPQSIAFDGTLARSFPCGFILFV